MAALRYVHFLKFLMVLRAKCMFEPAVGALCPLHIMHDSAGACSLHIIPCCDVLIIVWDFLEAIDFGEI